MVVSSFTFCVIYVMICMLMRICFSGGETRKGRTSYGDPATWTANTPDGPGFRSWTLSNVLEL